MHLSDRGVHPYLVAAPHSNQALGRTISAARSISLLCPALQPSKIHDSIPWQQDAARKLTALRQALAFSLRQSLEMLKQCVAEIAK